jgi:hypothetical protein
VTTRVIIQNPDDHTDIEVCTVCHGSAPNGTPTYGPGITIPKGTSREIHVWQTQSLYIREK